MRDASRYVTSWHVVAACGDGVTRFKPGDRVMAILPYGGLAERALAPEAETFAIPDRMSFEEAGAFPVLLIPAEGPEPGKDTPMQGPVKSVVVAVDSEARIDDAAVAHGVHWAQLCGARLTLAQAIVVVPLPAPGPEAIGPIAPIPPFMPDLRAHEVAGERLGAMCDALRQEGMDVNMQILSGDGPTDALLEHMDSSAADLLIVGRHPKSFWERLFEGSESTKLARRIRTAGLLVCHEAAR